MMPRVRLIGSLYIYCLGCCPSLAHLGAFLDHLGTILSHLGSILAHLLTQPSQKQLLVILELKMLLSSRRSWYFRWTNRWDCRGSICFSQFFAPTTASATFWDTISASPTREQHFYLYVAKTCYFSTPDLQRTPWSWSTVFLAWFGVFWRGLGRARRHLGLGTNLPTALEPRWR